MSRQLLPALRLDAETEDFSDGGDHGDWPCVLRGDWARVQQIRKEIPGRLEESLL